MPLFRSLLLKGDDLPGSTKSPRPSCNPVPAWLPPRSHPNAPRRKAAANHRFWEACFQSLLRSCLCFPQIFIIILCGSGHSYIDRCPNARCLLGSQCPGRGWRGSQLTGDLRRCEGDGSRERGASAVSVWTSLSPRGVPPTTGLCKSPTDSGAWVCVGGCWEVHSRPTPGPAMNRCTSR